VIPGVAWLFCPADRPDRYAKAARAADVVILDLEDAVAPANRERARAALAKTVLDPDRTVVRINPIGTEDHELDLAALVALPYRHIMLAKAESADGLDLLGGYHVVALCETPRGVLRAGEIAGSPHVVALMWGAEDLVAGLGGSSSRHRDGRYRDVARHARSSVLLAAAAAGVAALDSVYLDIADLDGLADEAEDAAASGFAAKACIHPSQVEVVRRAFAPEPEQVDWARRVLGAAEQQPGVFTFKGGMVDQPVLRHARRILNRAEGDEQG
jgi:citrate lyase subunit beta/citryl-CoA lyase